MRYNYKIFLLYNKNIYLVHYKSKNEELKIDEIYRSLDNYHNQLNANKEKFEKIYNENISSKTDTRNIILTLITFFAGFLVTVKDLENFKELFQSNLMYILFVLAIGGISVYIVFSIKKRDQHKNLLEILKEFHDGFTTISFMKGLLDRISLGFENFEEDQIDKLDNYYTMVKGGIAFQIRREIKKSIQEEEIYGTKEYVLYNILIYKAYKLSQVQNKGKKKREEDLLNQLFKNQKHDLLELKYIFDCYITLLEEHSLIIGEYSRILNC
jgi:hypothetical protein